MTRSIPRTLLLAGLLATIASLPARADLDVGLSASDDGVKGFYVAISEQYRVSTKEVIAVRKASIPDEELPVVLTIAQRAGVLPEFIIRYRLDGKSWMDITLQYGMTAEIFYVPVKAEVGPPYGRALGHFKGKKRSEWRTIRLADDDVINLVNLRFMMDRYDLSAERVIQCRHQGKNFVSINRDFLAEKNKANKKGKALAATDDSSSKAKDQGKVKGKSK